MSQIRKPRLVTFLENYILLMSWLWTNALAHIIDLRKLPSPSSKVSSCWSDL